MDNRRKLEDRTNELIQQKGMSWRQAWRQAEAEYGPAPSDKSASFKCPNCGEYANRAATTCDHCSSPVPETHRMYSWSVAATELGLPSQSGPLASEPNRIAGPVGDYRIDVRLIQGEGQHTRLKINMPDDIPLTKLGRRRTYIARALRQGVPAGVVHESEWNKYYKVVADDTNLFVLAGGQQLAVDLDHACQGRWSIKKRTLTSTRSGRAGGSEVVAWVRGATEALDRVRA